MRTTSWSWASKNTLQHLRAAPPSAVSHRKGARTLRVRARSWTRAAAPGAAWLLALLMLQTQSVPRLPPAGSPPLRTSAPDALAPRAAAGCVGGRPRRASAGAQPRAAHVCASTADSGGANDDAATLRKALADEYAQAANNYDTKWASYTQATVDATLAALPELPQDAVVLDLACGTGALMRGLESRGAPLREYVGLDNSDAMLAAAGRAVAARAPPFATRWVVGAADAALPMPDGSCDAVLSANSFHFFADPRECLAQASRVLKPGGVLLLSDWSADVWTCRLLEAFLRFTGSPTARVLTSAELRQLVAAAAPQLRVEEVRTSRLLTWWGFMVLRARKVDGGVAAAVDEASSRA
jgi:ubiquinone/menaquinone biosynthesis C-methylase UbiE